MQEYIDPNSRARDSVGAGALDATLIVTQAFWVEAASFMVHYDIGRMR